MRDKKRGQRELVNRHGPEWYIQRDLVKYLEARGWLVERMIGNAFQQGIPDLYCHHPVYGPRWIDVKNPKRYSFTRAQKWKWPKWDDAKVGIWIVTAATQSEYDKLFSPPNWRDYWQPSTVNVDELLDAIPQ